MIKVITSIVGEGKLIDQLNYDCDYVAFTKQISNTWRNRVPCSKFKNNALNAKIHKILTHRYLDGDYFMWIDGDITLTAEPKELVELMGDKDLLFFKHPTRDCLFDEVIDCQRIGRGDTEEMAEQYEDYSGFTRHNGLIESAVFIRKNNKEVNELMEKWWIEISRYSSRDQVSWPVVFQKKEFVLLDGFLNNKWFKYKK